MQLSHVSQLAADRGAWPSGREAAGRHVSDFRVRSLPVALGEPFTLWCGGPAAHVADLELYLESTDPEPVVVGRLRYRYDSQVHSLTPGGSPICFDRYQVSLSPVSGWQRLRSVVGAPRVALRIDALPCRDEDLRNLPLWTDTPGICSPVIPVGSRFRGFQLEVPSQMTWADGLPLCVAFRFLGSELRAHETSLSERIRLVMRVGWSDAAPAFDLHQLRWVAACQVTPPVPGMHISVPLPRPPSPASGLLAERLHTPSSPAGQAPLSVSAQLGPEHDSEVFADCCGLRLPTAITAPAASFPSTCTVTAEFGPYRTCSRPIQVTG
jgi:hypothetical protein